MALCRLGHFYLLLSLEACIWFGCINNNKNNNNINNDKNNNNCINHCIVCTDVNLFIWLSSEYMVQLTFSALLAD